MDWYRLAISGKETKVADVGHGNTLEGQMLIQSKNRLAKEIDQLRTSAATGGPAGVLPRWRGEVRQKILQLPALIRLDKMSMFEISQVLASVDAIKQSMEHYSEKRFKEITNADNSGQRGKK